jgi:endonuclease/exonuclease/phosphatase family metal-dependent hydrolase
VVTIDHVVVDNRAAVRDYRVFDVPGSDHHAVFAEVQLP